jgi:hypothetical protein
VNAPAKISIDGGMYRNRMIPFFDDLAILQGNGDFSGLLSDLQFYDFLAIRFLKFRFPFGGEQIVIRNVFVYGIPELNPPVIIRDSIPQLQRNIGHDCFHVDAILIDCPPFGEGNVPAEFVLRKGNQSEWKPIETSVLLSILLRSLTKVTGISVSCSAPVTIRINSMNFDIEPPIGQGFLGCELHTRTLQMLVIGKSIRINEIAIIGDPIQYILHRSRDSRWTMPDLSELKYAQLILDKTESKGKYQVKVPAGFLVAGFWFSAIKNFIELLVKYLPWATQEEAMEWELEHFRVPVYQAACQISLREPVEMEKCQLSFIGTNEQFKEPKIRAFGRRTCQTGGLRMQRSPSAAYVLRCAISVHRRT